MVPTFANRFPCSFGAPRQTLAGPQQAGKDGGRGRRYCGGMRVDISPEATAFVGAHGGRLWVWAAPPRMCCAGTPSYMHAATSTPRRASGFSRVPAAGLELWFRPPAGTAPQTLEIGLRGRRHPRVEAYWDGCLFALYG